MTIEISDKVMMILCSYFFNLYMNNIQRENIEAARTPRDCINITHRSKDKNKKQLVMVM
ncbi:hypothetical protein GCM10007855_32720 [Aliivibrio sifiae]|uniref:Uncharacterized protein n=1 Tax=Aliivibrio sifiae TaxID=566293 RepID=A0ABQ6AKF1_9GAMM|nr:hypothetical protein GCM10007855_32720 [Aliivibrio sifiae]